MPVDAVAAAMTILAIGGLNYFGPTKTGTVAMVVALATVALTLVIGVACLPHSRARPAEDSPSPRGGVWSPGSGSPRSSWRSRASRRSPT